MRKDRRKHFDTDCKWSWHFSCTESLCNDVVILVFPWGSGFYSCQQIVMTSFWLFLVYLQTRGWREWFHDSDPSLIILQHCHLYRKSSRTLEPLLYVPRGLRSCEYHIFGRFLFMPVYHIDSVFKRKEVVLFIPVEEPLALHWVTLTKEQSTLKVSAPWDPKLLSTINNRRVQFVQLYSLNETLQEATNFLIEYCTGIVSCTYGQR